MTDYISIPKQLVSRLTMIATLSVLKAGEMLKKGFGSPMNFTNKKGRHNLVTEWDQKSEEIIIELIKSHFPDHSILAEESGQSSDNNDSILWIVDPLDGTVNFAHNIPLFSVSVAATYKQTILAGAVYNPMLNELFTAEKDNGSFLNGSKLATSQTAVLDSAILATGLPYNVHENPLQCINHLSAFAKTGIPLRRMGSAAIDLCYVACGRFDGFWEVSLSPWDYAAAKLIIEEAGGCITDFNGNPITSFTEKPILASNIHLAKQIQKKITATINNEAN